MLPQRQVQSRGTWAATQSLNRVSLGFVMAENPGWASGKPYGPALAAPGCTRPEACQGPALPCWSPGLRVPLLLFLQLHRPCIPPASLSLPFPAQGRARARHPAPGARAAAQEEPPTLLPSGLPLGELPFQPRGRGPAGQHVAWGPKPWVRVRLSHLLTPLPPPQAAAFT